MKKVILCLLVVGVVAFAGPMLLLETYQKGMLVSDELIDTTLLELEFSVDSNCYALFSTGGYHRYGIMWCVLDGESLPHTTRKTSIYGQEQPLDQTYMCMLSAGFHTMEFRWRNMPPTTLIQDARLQALIFLPDTATSAVIEQPMSDAEPGVSTPSLISQGHYVNVARSHRACRRNG